MKTVYGWVVFWPKGCFPKISIDLFFSSKEAFEEACAKTFVNSEKEQLVSVLVPEDFDDLDYIPDNY